MQITFLESKDGSKTFSADGMLYHSSYSPAKEAQRFVEAAQFLYKPKILFLIEPGLNYCLDFFKQKLPDCKIVCVRFFNQKFDDESSWDSVIRFENPKDLSQVLINSFGEEDLLCSTLLIWKPAEQMFAQNIQNFISEYKTTLESCKTLLVTRQFFEKKWLINSCNFIMNAQHLLKPQIKTTLSVVICASGPSLEPCLKSIKEFRKKLFVLCLSSALNVLINNDIIPDLILSTDGGYWAGEHLKLLKKNHDIPLAVPIEAFVPKQILKNNKLLVLRYNDQSSFICTELLDKAGLDSYEALRNPTVSGTGLFFAKSITSNKVFFCGLDLASSKGFGHTQPNELEKNNCLKDCRIKTLETRQSSSRFNSSSLQIYRNWFEALEKNDCSDVYRIIASGSQKPLGNIKDISYKDFEYEIKTAGSKLTDSKQNIQFTETSLTRQNRKTAIDYVIQMLETQKWKCQIFPADFISIQNCSLEQDKAALQKRLDDKIQKLVQKIRKIADE